MDQEIPEETDVMGDEEGMDLDFGDMDEVDESLRVSQSTVFLKKHNLEINKHGASNMLGSSATTPNINSELIKEVRKIGSGAAGTVYLSLYNINGKEMPVAVKEIPVQDKNSRDQFVNDLKVFLNNTCPFIVHFYGCFYEEGYLKEVLEYMDCGSLRNVVNFQQSQNRLLGEQILAQISLSILKGLLYIHKQKHQIHRDIKPENILINTDGEIKITDFGISKQLERTSGLSKTNIGTTIYMSPERIIATYYSSKSDVWSFGLVLFELATCRPIPYSVGIKDISDMEMISRITHGPPPSFIPEDCRSAQLSDFLAQCLEKDVDKRASVESLLKHDWLVKNCGKSSLKQFMRFITHKLKKME